jgi:hypothetical protein
MTLNKGCYLRYYILYILSYMYSCHHVMACIILIVYFTSIFPATGMNSRIKTEFSRSRYHMVLWTSTDALEKLIMFYTKDGGKRFLQNNGTLLLDYIVS